MLNKPISMCWMYRDNRSVIENSWRKLKFYAEYWHWGWKKILFWYRFSTIQESIMALEFDWCINDTILCRTICMQDVDILSNMIWNFTQLSVVQTAEIRCVIFTQTYQLTLMICIRHIVPCFRVLIVARVKILLCGCRTLPKDQLPMMNSVCSNMSVEVAAIVDQGRSGHSTWTERS